MVTQQQLAPKVAFEILSPSNTAIEMIRKFLFYQQYGIEEYYVYDPSHNELVGFKRQDGKLIEILDMQGWQSPHLGIRFELDDETLHVHYPNGDRFFTPVELTSQLNLERQRAEQAEQRAEQAEQKSQQLAEQLRSLGINPDAI